jgi:hypothetical protein
MMSEEDIDLELRQEIARRIKSAGMIEQDFQVKPDLSTLPEGELKTAELGIDLPDDFVPKPQPLQPEPQPSDPLPPADVVVFTYTVAECTALANVFTPGYTRHTWYPYTRYFKEHYELLIRKGAPASKSQKLGSYFLTRIGTKTVLCYKSELHLAQDAIPTGKGTATLPLKDLFSQITKEVSPEVFLTTGTAGGVGASQPLGGVAVTRGALFYLKKDFANEPFNNKKYTSHWDISDRWFPTAVAAMNDLKAHIAQPAFEPPTKQYSYEGPPIQPPFPDPVIQLDNTKAVPEFWPVITTDVFLFGTSTNDLDKMGIAVEMDDAVLGMVLSEMDDPPYWASVRNFSDPQINGDLPKTPHNMQEHWAAWYYDTYGYWTSINSVLANWAIVAGLNP